MIIYITFFLLYKNAYIRSVFLLKTIFAIIYLKKNKLQKASYKNRVIFKKNITKSITKYMTVSPNKKRIYIVFKQKTTFQFF